MSDTPRTDVQQASVMKVSQGYLTETVSADWARDLERELIATIRERDAARALADPYVCDFIRNESGEEDGGWRCIDTQPEGMEAELHYAAARALIERDPTRQGWFRFTKAAEAHL